MVSGPSMGVGRTIPTYRLHLESILNDWMDYRRALREKDRETFDRVISKARQHASAASYCAHMDPTILALLSVLLEMEREIETLKRERSSVEPLSVPRADPLGGAGRRRRVAADRPGVLRSRLRLLRGPGSARRVAVPHRGRRRSPRGVLGRAMVQREASDRLRVLHRGGLELPATGHRANPRRRIDEAVRTAGRDPHLRRGDGGERRVPRIVRLPRIREGSSARPLAVVRLARPLGRTADGARAPRGPPGPHPHRHAVTALVWHSWSTDLEKAAQSKPMTFPGCDSELQVSRGYK